MKLVTFLVRDDAHDDTRDEARGDAHGEARRGPRLGALIDVNGAAGSARVVDLRRAEQQLRGFASDATLDMQRWLEAGQRGWDAVMHLLEQVTNSGGEFLHPLEDVQLLSPLPRPMSLRDCLEFEGHWIQCARRVADGYLPGLGRLDSAFERIVGRSLLRPPRVWYERPIYYKGNVASVVGTDVDVHWPKFSEHLDFELEWGVFVGQRARNLTVAEAARAIAGYAVFNDFTARDVQQREMAGRLGPAKSKDFDSGNAIGPWLTTADEIVPGQSLRMEARVNGECWCRAETSAMRFSFPEILAFISQSETLYPGDFIASGTPRGGCGWELNRRLEPGDVVELEVERLGVLRNRIARRGVL